MICPLCKQGEATELKKWRNANLTRVRCKRCRRQSIVNVSEVENAVS